MARPTKEEAALRPKRGPNPRPGSSRSGRGKVLHINYDILNALLQYKVTARYCAEQLDMSVDTLERRLREDYDMTFSEYASMRMEKTGLMLQKKAIEEAMKGQPALMIFALKNIAGWTDKVEENLKQSPIQINISEPEASDL